MISTPQTKLWKIIDYANDSDVENAAGIDTNNDEVRDVSVKIALTNFQY